MTSPSRLPAGMRQPPVLEVRVLVTSEIDT
jgi:hypothetical protein